MSLVFGSREVSVGPTVGFQGDVGSRSPTATATAAYVSKHRLSFSTTSNPCNPISKDEQQKKRISCFSVDPSDLSNSSDNSSIDGLDSDTDDDDQSRSTTENGEDDGNEVRSKFKGSLCSMESLEDSLPIKRGLSNFFSGKSKSFANLSDATTVKSLQKRENPFNKRRRTLIACKWSRRGGFYSSMNPVSMPLLALNEDEVEEEEQQSDLDHEDHHQKINNNQNQDQDDDEDDSDNSISYVSNLENRKIRSFKSSRCFSLTDLQQH